MDTLERNDELLPVPALFTCEFGDQLDIEYDFFGGDSDDVAPMLVDEGADWFGDQLVME